MTTEIDITNFGGVVGSLVLEGKEELAQTLAQIVYDMLDINLFINGSYGMANFMKNNQSIDHNLNEFITPISDSLNDLFILNHYNLPDILISMLYGANISVISANVNNRTLGLFSLSDTSHIQNLIRNSLIIKNNIEKIIEYDETLAINITDYLTGFKIDIYNGKIIGLLKGLSGIEPDDVINRYGIGLVSGSVSGLNTLFYSTLTALSKYTISFVSDQMYKKLFYANGLIFHLKSLQSSIDQVREHDLFTMYIMEIDILINKINSIISRMSTLYTDSIDEGVSLLTKQKILQVKTSYEGTRNKLSGIKTLLTDLKTQLIH
jgi:hypothetical protein